MYDDIQLKPFKKIDRTNLDEIVIAFYSNYCLKQLISRESQEKFEDYCSRDKALFQDINAQLGNPRSEFIKELDSYYTIISPNYQNKFSIRSYELDEAGLLEFSIKIQEETSRILLPEKMLELFVSSALSSAYLMLGKAQVRQDKWPKSWNVKTLEYYHDYILLCRENYKSYLKSDNNLVTDFVPEHHQFTDDYLRSQILEKARHCLIVELIFETPNLLAKVHRSKLPKYLRDNYHISLKDSNQSNTMYAEPYAVSNLQSLAQQVFKTSIALRKVSSLNEFKEAVIHSDSPIKFKQAVRELD